MLQLVQVLREPAATDWMEQKTEKHIHQETYSVPPYHHDFFKGIDRWELEVVTPLVPINVRVTIAVYPKRDRSKQLQFKHQLKDYETGPRFKNLSQNKTPMASPQQIYWGLFVSLNKKPCGLPF